MKKAKKKVVWGDVTFWICVGVVVLNLPILIMAMNRHDDVGMQVALTSLGAGAMGAWLWRKNDESND